MQLEELAKEWESSIDIILTGLSLGAGVNCNKVFNTALDALIDDYFELKGKEQCN